MRDDLRYKLATLAQVMVVSAILGALYAGSFGNDAAALRGGAMGALVCFLVAGFESFVNEGRVERLLTAMPFPAFILIKTAIYFGLVMLGLGTVGFLFGFGPTVPAITLDAFLYASMSLPDVAVGVGISAGFSLFFAVNDLLGRGVLLSFLLGRYHTPREETRIFLLIDLVGSTAAAERLGNLQFYTFINRFVQTVCTAIQQHDGRIYAYVGDAVIAEWSSGRGTAKARCVRAVQSAADLVRRYEVDFVREFGLSPRFRAVLHVGPVVAGEMGGAKREIVLMGDTLNVASRIEAHAKALGETVVASQALIDMLTLPPEITARRLDDADLRGVSRPVALTALDF